MLLNNLISQKATQSKEEAVTFENSLALEFDSLQAKSNENVVKIEKQISILNKVTKIEDDIANKVAVISAMVSKNALLESIFYSKIEQEIPALSNKQKQNTSYVKSTSPVSIPASSSQQKSPKKMASGGVIAAPQIEENKGRSRNTQSESYAETLQLPLEASGIYAVSMLGDFVKATGSLGGFFAPYVKTIVKPFALALGVSDSIITTLLGGPVKAATIDMGRQQQDFGETWGKFLGDEDFIAKFIDRTIDGTGGLAPDGTENFNGSVNAEKAYNYFVSKGLTPEQSAGIVGNLIQESGVNPNSTNSKSGNTGIAQWDANRWGYFTSGKTYNGKEWKAVEPSNTRKLEDQLRYLWWELESGAGGLSLTTYKNATTLEEATGIFLDKFERPGAYEAVLPQRITNAKGVLSKYNKSSPPTTANKFESGGIQKSPMFGSVPYLMCGSESGYDAFIQGMPVTLHGCEIIAPTEEGFQVYPIKNRKYNIFEDPMGVTKRWKEIVNGSNTQNVTSFSAGGEAFWQMAAITAREDTLHPQGQADVAQALYNRLAVGSYPGGRNLLGIITAPGQFEPTFKNPGDWKSIHDRRSAIAAAGSAKLVDMAAQSISSPELQKEAARFVGGRTDFQGESQKGSMKPGDITRGKNHNFFGWFYDAKLPKAAPIPQMIASQARTVASSSGSKQNIIINKINTPQSPNIIQQVQSAVTYIPNLIFNPHKLRREIGMKRAR